MLIILVHQATCLTLKSSSDSSRADTPSPARVRVQRIRVEFVDSAPRPLDDGVLYISERFHTALHKCCCGCGQEVVTPLNPAKWSYTKHGKTITLSPSVGNWSFTCRSHYLIIKNEVVWAHSMTTRQISNVKARDARDQSAHLENLNNEKLGLKTVNVSLSPLSKLALHIRNWWSE